MAGGWPAVAIVGGKRQASIDEARHLPNAERARLAAHATGGRHWAC
jgi:hypothetical protein